MRRKKECRGQDAMEIRRSRFSQRTGKLRTGARHGPFWTPIRVIITGRRCPVLQSTGTVRCRRRPEVISQWARALAHADRKAIGLRPGADPPNDGVGGGRQSGAACMDAGSPTESAGKERSEEQEHKSCCERRITEPRCATIRRRPLKETIDKMRKKRRSSQDEQKGRGRDGKDFAGRDQEDPRIVRRQEREILKLPVGAGVSF